MYGTPEADCLVPDSVRAAFATRAHLTLPQLAEVAEIDGRTLRGDLADGLIDCRRKGRGS